MEDFDVYPGGPLSGEAWGLAAGRGVAPPLARPVLDPVASAWLGKAPGQSLAELAPLTAIAWANGALALLLLLLYLFLARRRREMDDRVPTWDCGYAMPAPRMQYSASSFAERLVGLFSFVLRPRVEAPKLATTFRTPC